MIYAGSETDADVAAAAAGGRLVVAASVAAGWRDWDWDWRAADWDCVAP